MKRITLIIVIIAVGAVGAYFASNYFETKAKKQREQAEQKAEQERDNKRRQMATAAVAQMVSKYNAIDDWEKKLRRGKKSGSERILTMELENLWLTEKPILFKGRIKDISNFDSNNYLMRIKMLRRFDKILELSLKVPKSMLDSFFKEYPKASSEYSSIAFIAKLNRIESSHQIDKEDNEVETVIGIGQCLDVLYIGNRSDEVTIGPEEVEHE